MSSTELTPPVLIITVRGSTEPASGSRLLTPIARAVARHYRGEVEVHSLAYPATFESFDATYPARIDLGESPAIGVRNLVSVLNGRAIARPEQRIVLLGWSQGAQVITDVLVSPHLRCAGQDAPRLDHPASERIDAIALFGNPTFSEGQPYNAGEFASGISGVTPRIGDPLAAYAGRMRDYC